MPEVTLFLYSSCYLIVAHLINKRDNNNVRVIPVDVRELRKFVASICLISLI